MADVAGNGARKRRELNGAADGNSPVKKVKMEEDEPPEANPNTVEGVRDKNKAMALDLVEKNRRIAFLAHKCESLFRQSAVSQRAFRCIQRQWVQLVDDLSSASRVLGESDAPEWRDVVAKTESLGVLRLPRDVVTVAMPEWFLAISRRDKEAELPPADDDDDEPEATSELLTEKEKQVESALRDEQARVHDVLRKVLAAISSGGPAKLEFKELVAEKREATAQVLELQGEVVAMQVKLADMQADLEAKEVERHRACRDYDRLKQFVEKTSAAAATEAEAANGVTFENGHAPKQDGAGDEKNPKAHARPGEKRVTLLDPETKPSGADREVVQKLNSDKVILLQKLKEERQKVESMRSELTRLQAQETAFKQEQTRLQVENDATIARLRQEIAQLTEASAASQRKEKADMQHVQQSWKAQLEKIQEDAAKTKSKMNDLVFKNTALRDKLSSFSAYRDQLSDLKSQHESTKREADRLKGELKRVRGQSVRATEAADRQETIEMREKLAATERQRDEFQRHVRELTESQAKSADKALADAVAREADTRQVLDLLRAEHSALTAELEKVRVDLETATANQDAFKDESDALVGEIEALNKEVEATRHSKKKVLKQLEEKRQSAKKLQSELAKESDLRLSSTEELGIVRLQASSLKYVHTQQKAALEASLEAQKTKELELDELRRYVKMLENERDHATTDKLKAEREADVARQMFKAEATHKQRQVLQDKSRACDRCETYRKKEADYEKRIAALRASVSASGSGDGASGLTELERFELQDLQKQLKCSVCQDRHKNVIISKCSHLFCRECVDSNLKSRNRKCPTCKKMFGQDDVKNVWFT